MSYLKHQHCKPVIGKRAHKSQVVKTHTQRRKKKAPKVTDPLALFLASRRAVGGPSFQQTLGISR